MLTESEITKLTQDVAEVVGLLNVGVILFASGNSPARARGAMMMGSAWSKLGKWSQQLAKEAAD